METMLFPPLLASFMLVLVLVLGVGALVAAAYNWSMLVAVRKDFKKLTDLAKDVTFLRQEINNLKKADAGDNGSEPAAPQPASPLKGDSASNQAYSPLATAKPVWSNFVMDYNSLAVSMNVPKADEACRAFVENYHLALLAVDMEKSRQQGGTVPQYKQVDTIENSCFWAWKIPVAGLDNYAVVPNPMHKYNAKLHNEAGMKETFASNFTDGEYSGIMVKLPATFAAAQGTWKIKDPGAIRLN